MNPVALICLGLTAPLATLNAALAGDGLAGASEAAWQRALQRLESAGRTVGAAAERRVASAWWADTPALELSHRTGDWGNNPGLRESEIALAWPAWLPGQRGALLDAAAAESERAIIAEQEARLRVAGEVRELAWRVAALTAEENGANARAQHLAALAQDTERRLAAGELPRSDALAVRAEWLDAQGAALAASRALEAARAEWTLLTGAPVVQNPEEAVPPAEGAPEPDEHPTVRLADASAAHARAQLHAARLTRIDQPELRVLYREEVAMEGLPTERSMGIGLRLPLGGARKAPRNVAAESAVELAGAAAERAREARRLAVALARAELGAAERHVETTETRTTLLRERIGLLERAYREGETSLAEILRERHALAEAETTLARGHAAFGLAKARLRQSLGMLP